LTPAIANPARSPVATGDAAGEYDMSALLSANLFGQAAPTARSSVSLEAIPTSSMNLVLSGVMVTPGGSFALISTDGGEELPFALGQDIVAGVTLYAVYADRVLIRRGGATESLLLKDTGDGLANGSVMTAKAAPARRASAPSGRGAVQPQGSGTFAVDRQQLTQQMQTPEFLSQALMVPNAGGGFLVREIQPGSVYEKLGLRVGDVINAVNGQAVNSVEDVMRLYGQFSTATSVQVDVRRAGKNETLVYNIQ
jgi:general secretion pathway protein C